MDFALRKNHSLLNNPSIPIALARSVASIGIPERYENLMNDQQVSEFIQHFILVLKM
jgi:hypothetical protein